MTSRKRRLGSRSCARPSKDGPSATPMYSCACTSSTPDRFEQPGSARTGTTPGASRRIMPPMSIKKLIWITVVVALAACSKKRDDAGKGGAAGAGGASACANAAAKGVASLSGGPEAGGVKEKLQAIYTTRCTEDKWPAEVIQCFETAVGMQGLKTCRGKLSPELAAKVQAEIMGAMAGAAGMMGGRAPMGHPGTAPAGDPAAGAGAAGGNAPGGPPAAP